VESKGCAAKPATKTTTLAALPRIARGGRADAAWDFRAALEVRAGARAARLLPHAARSQPLRHPAAPHHPRIWAGPLGTCETSAPLKLELGGPREGATRPKPCRGSGWGPTAMARRFEASPDGARGRTHAEAASKGSSGSCRCAIIGVPRCHVRLNLLSTFKHTCFVFSPKVPCL